MNASPRRQRVPGSSTLSRSRHFEENHRAAPTQQAGLRRHAHRCQAASTSDIVIAPPGVAPQRASRFTSGAALAINGRRAS